MAKEPIKGIFLGVVMPDKPNVIHPPEYVNGQIKIIPASADKLREAIIKNLGRTGK